MTCRIACRECGRTTRGGKPYCPDHVDRMTYVVALGEQTRARIPMPACRICGRRPLPPGRWVYCGFSCRREGMRRIGLQHYREHYAPH